MTIIIIIAGVHPALAQNLTLTLTHEFLTLTHDFLTLTYDFLILTRGFLIDTRVLIFTLVLVITHDRALT